MKNMRRTDGGHLVNQEVQRIGEEEAVDEQRKRQLTEAEGSELSEHMV